MAVSLRTVTLADPTWSFGLICNAPKYDYYVDDGRGECVYNRHPVRPLRLPLRLIVHYFHAFFYYIGGGSTKEKVISFWAAAFMNPQCPPPST